MKPTTRAGFESKLLLDPVRESKQMYLPCPDGARWSAGKSSITNTPTRCNNYSPLSPLTFFLPFNNILWITPGKLSYARGGWFNTAISFLANQHGTELIQIWYMKRMCTLPGLYIIAFVQKSVTQKTQFA